MRASPFALLCGTGLFAIFSSTISKSPVLPLFAVHLGANPSEVGMVAAVSAFTGIVVSIPAGMFSDRWGRRRMLLISATIFSTAPFFYLLVTKLWHLAIIRFYHGFATALFIPVAMALVSDLFHEGRGERMGLFSASTLLGRFLAPAAGGTIIGALALNQAVSYKAVYLVCGASGIVALLLSSRIPKAPGVENKHMEWKKTFQIFKRVISKNILTTSMVEASVLFAYGTFETFLPLYSISIGLSAYQVGIFLSAQVITLALTKPLMGRFSDRHGREPQIFAGALIGAACIGTFSLFRSFLPLLVLSIAFGLSLSIVTSATSAFVADLSSIEARGSAMGLLGSIMDMGHTTGPLVSGIIATFFGYAKAFIGASFILVLVSIIFFAAVMTGKEKQSRRGLLS